MNWSAWPPFVLAQIDSEEVKNLDHDDDDATKIYMNENIGRYTNI